MIEPIFALLTGTVALAAAVIAMIAKLRKQVQEIHVLVNDRMTEALARIDQLIKALGDAGVAVPARRDEDRV